MPTVAGGLAAVKAALLLACVLTCSGCAAALLTPALVLDATVGRVGIYQRLRDREATNAQTVEITALREEIARLRGALNGGPGE